MPKVSVCVPTFNRAGLLRESLSTLLAQDATDYEILVVDNCSTDDTGDVVRSFGDARIRYVRNERNLGSRGNWNRCIDLAAGDYVAICHDDDLYAREFVRECRGFLDEHPSVGFVHSGFTLIDADGVPTRRFLAYPASRVLPSAQIFRSFLAEIHNVGFSTVMVRREAYRDAGPFETDFLCADFDMWLRLAYRFDVGYISKSLVLYRTHSDSTTQTLSPFRWYDENRQIVERAIAMAAPRMPGLVADREQILARVQSCWSRRCLREAMSRISHGQVEAGREYLAAAAALANTRALRMKVRSARLLIGSAAAVPLGIMRTALRKVRLFGAVFMPHSGSRSHGSVAGHR
jgi:glycosyltransferase involved in cell wall biosynthesis